MADSPRLARLRRLGWPTFVGACLAGWLALMLRPTTLGETLPHWPMTVVMAAASLVAGSTPMGGGAVAFPMLVLAFGRTPAMARDYSLAIQSVGMLSALLFILRRRIPVEPRVLAWSSAGAAAGLVCGTAVLAGRVPADSVKLLFASLWVTFGGWLSLQAGFIEGREPRPAIPGRAARYAGLAAGFTGGLVASLIGVGVEMTVFAVLVARFGWEPRAAVPTAVSAMAVASPVGVALRAATVGLLPGVFHPWLAAVPIVIFGAPLGAYLSTRIPRRLLLRAIGVLVLLQFALTIQQVRPGVVLWTGIGAVCAGGVLVLRLLTGPTQPSATA